MIKKSHVTLRDVAKAAGVSYNTVSLVVHDSPLVLSTTKERVRTIIEQMGYHPNAAASALRSARSRTLGYLVWREPETLLDEEVDVFRNRLFKAISDCAQEHDYYVLQNTIVDADRCLSLFQSKRIDGFLIDMLIPQTVVETLIENQVPLVLIGRDSGDHTLSWVKADERGGTYQATQHLLKHKHQTFGLISVESENHPIVVEREAGFLQALSEAGIPFDPTYHVYGNWTFESGYAQCQQLLEREPRPTAIFALNELMAVGCMQMAQDMGLRVPRDLSIVTVEDSFWVKYVRPQLTAVHVPMYEVGKRATEILLTQLDSSVDTPQHIVVPTTFVARDSSTRVRAARQVKTDTSIA